MNRIVLGTASLGSLVTPAAARHLLEVAYGAGIRRFDTAPFYGAGYATGLVASLNRPDILVSTKFGSRREPSVRYWMKRVLRSHGGERLFTASQPWYSNQQRLDAHWWDVAIQEHAIACAVAPVVSMKPEFLFLHAPPVPIPAAILQGLASEAHRWGFALGLCSAPPEHLPYWMGNLDVLGCVQLHLDDILGLPPSAQEQLLCRPIWVHGIYTPGAHARLQEHESREAFCIDFAAGRSMVHFVIGAKSAAGLGRLSNFAARQK